MFDTVLLVSAASAVGDRAYKDGGFWVASLRYLVTPRRRRRFEASTRSAAGSPLSPASQREDVFLVSVFLRFKSSEGLAPFSRRTSDLHARFQPT
jgi:hypothetical protein